MMKFDSTDIKETLFLILVFCFCVFGVYSCSQLEHENKKISLEKYKMSQELQEKCSEKNGTWIVDNSGVGNCFKSVEK